MVALGSFYRSIIELKSITKEDVGTLASIYVLCISRPEIEFGFIYLARRRRRLVRPYSATRRFRTNGGGISFAAWSVNYILLSLIRLVLLWASVRGPLHAEKRTEWKIRERLSKLKVTKATRRLPTKKKGDFRFHGIEYSYCL